MGRGEKNVPKRQPTQCRVRFSLFEPTFLSDFYVEWEILFFTRLKIVASVERVVNSRPFPPPVNASVSCEPHFYAPFLRSVRSPHCGASCDILFRKT